MSDSYVIEIRPPRTGRTVQAGIVVRDRGGFTFFAAADEFFALEGRSFKNPKAAELAAEEAAAEASLRLAAALRGQSLPSATILQPSR